MCFADTPSMPAPEVPQAAKPPDRAAGTADARQRAAQNGGNAASTLLTGPSGVENSALSLSKTTLLGQ